METTNNKLSSIKKYLENLQTNALVHYIALFLIGLLGYSLFLGGYPLLSPDEARYTEIARGMLANHQFITPALNGVLFFDKPILFYWFEIAALWFFGINEFAARFFPMLFSLIGALCIYNVSEHFFNRRTAWVAALILLASPLYYFTGHYANLDMEVAVWLTASISFYLRAYDPNTKTFARGWLYTSYIMAAGAILTKGLIGLAFPMMVIGLWILLTNQWVLLKRMRIATGLLVVLLFCLPWFILVEYINPGFSHYYFYVQQILRFLTPNFNNHQPFWFYLPIVLGGMFPWLLLLYPALKSAYKEKNSINLFLLIWAGAIFVFFSIPQSKLIGYIVPVLPPLAILIARVESKLSLNYKRLSLIFSIAILALLILTALIFSHQLNAVWGISLPLQALLISILLFILAIWALALKFFPKQALIVLAFGYLGVFNLGLYLPQTLAKGVITHYFPIKAAVQIVKPLVNNSTQIIAFEVYFQDLPFYMQKPILIARNWDKPNLAEEDNWQGESAYVMKYLQPDAKNILISFSEMKQRWQQPAPVFIFVTSKRLPKLQKILGIDKLNIIAKEGKIIVISNQRL